MEITTDLLRTLRNRIDQYCLAVYNKEPYNLTIDDDGIIYVEIGEYFRGEWDGETFVIKAEELTDNLDYLIKERKEREELQRIQYELAREQARIKSEEQDKRNRHAQYLQLKKEFES